MLQLFPFTLKTKNRLVIKIHSHRELLLIWEINC